MKSFCLLPISLILLTPGFSVEKATPSLAEIQIVSIDNSKGLPEIALLNNQTKETSALEIDPLLVEELKEEISAILQKSSLEQNGIADASGSEITTNAYRNAYGPRTRQQLPRKQEMIEEEEFQQEEALEMPLSQTHSHSARASKAPKASDQSPVVEQEAQHPSYERKQRSHVRHYPSKIVKAPRTRAESYTEEEQLEMQSERQRTASQRSQPVRTPRAQANTVDANNTQRSRALARRHQAQEDIADTEFDQPIQQERKAPAKRQATQPGPRNRSRENAAQKGAQHTQKKMPQRQNVDKSSVHTQPAQSSVRSHTKQGVAQMNDTQNQRYSNQRQRNQPSQQDQGMGQTPFPDSQKMMTNTPTRPMPQNGYDFWVMGEALLWQAIEENLTYAYTGATSQNSRTLHTVDFNWDWGFRLGIGYNTPHDGWDLDLYWTHIRNTAHDHVHRSTEREVFQVWTVASQLLAGTLEEASANWRVHLDQVDFDLGRQFYVGSHLTLRPYVGARSTWLFQRYSTETENTRELKQHAKLKNRFWGFGFAAGLDTDWKFGWGISMYGEADMAILLGFHDVDQSSKQSGSHIWKQDKSFRVGRAILDLGMGLKWAQVFFKERLGITLKAGYEYHLYFDQNQFILTNGSSAHELFNPVNGNLIYQGVTGSIQLDF